MATKFSKKKQARLDFLESEYKKYLKVVHIVDAQLYKYDIAPSVHFNRIVKVIYP